MSRPASSIRAWLRGAWSVVAGLATTVLAQLAFARAWYWYVGAEHPAADALLTPPPPVALLALASAVGGAVTARLAPSAPRRHAAVVPLLLTLALVTMGDPAAILEPDNALRVAMFWIGSWAGASLAARSGPPIAHAGA